MLGTANETQASLTYQGYNIGLGYKKRLVQIIGKERKVVARCFS